jgi:uncharacterized protein involved in response to NO
MKRVFSTAVARDSDGWIVLAGQLAPPASYVATEIGAGALRSAGFGIYFVRYWPILTRPRLDRRPG